MNSNLIGQIIYTFDGGGKTEAKIPVDGCGGDSLVTKSSAGNEEYELASFLYSIDLLSLN